jgi:HrpA-like RNA helicase
VELRVQALFGLDRHPVIGQPARPLLLSLTSPAGRPIQTTADLPAFWRGSWRDVVKDMKGRYPRHRWPDEPWAEAEPQDQERVRGVAAILMMARSCVRSHLAGCAESLS